MKSRASIRAKPRLGWSVTRTAGACRFAGTGSPAHSGHRYSTRVTPIIVMASILLTDLLYVVVDPRITFSKAEAAA